MSENIVGTLASPIDPRLNPLALNGGFTRTRALHNDSPAIDKGSDPNAEAFDQRGFSFARLVGSKPDISTD